MVFKRYWALERGEPAQRQSVRSATSLTGEQWCLDPGFFGSPLLLSYQPPPTPLEQRLHPYSQPPAPCHIRLPEPPLRPSLIVTQLGMGDQASWEEARA